MVIAGVFLMSFLIFILLAVATAIALYIPIASVIWLCERFDPHHPRQRRR